MAQVYSSSAFCLFGVCAYNFQFPRSPGYCASSLCTPFSFMSSIFHVSDLPTFYEIKAEDLPPFGKKPQKIFMLGKFNDILSDGDTEIAYFSVLTSPNSTKITKPVLNNNTFICLSILFAVTSIVRKKRKNFKINRDSERFQKKRSKRRRSSALSEDLAGLMFPLLFAVALLVLTYLNVTVVLL